MGPPHVLLIIPPLTQLNTPYPSTAYLTGFLQSRGYAVEKDSPPDGSKEIGFVAQADVGIEMVLALFSRSGLGRVFDSIRGTADLPGVATQMLSLERAYLNAIEPLIAFLQGRDPALAPLICQGSFLPQGPRFASIQATRPRISTTDLAKHLATLYLEDLADLIQQTVSPHFALSRYAEHIGASASSFDTIAVALNRPAPLTDELMLDAVWRHMVRVHPTVVGLTVPFPGNLYGALRIAQSIKARCPDISVVLGGGHANTELRRLNDPRVFDLVNYIMLDDGERPLLCVLEHLVGKRDEVELKRTFVRRDGKVMYRNGALEPDFGMAELGTPTYVGLPLPSYLSILDTLNPMHRLWSEGHWNKLTVAHGWYWKQCTFCDVGLDYIRRYEITPTEHLVGQIERLIDETGRRTFHFVDEAAPPAALKSLAIALLERDVRISWWGNIRFEEAFTPDLCRLLAASGCIAVTAGLEAASDRLLVKMKKGITVDQTARVAAAFREIGILVHAYLMYGFPSETVQETIDSLERVRQLFSADLVQSAFWHRFTATAHSPIGLDPKANGLRILGPDFQGFAENDLIHLDRRGQTPEWIGEGLRRSMLNFLEGRGLSMDVREWFDYRTPRPRVSSKWAHRTLQKRRLDDDATAERHCVWIGEPPVVESQGKRARLHVPGGGKETAVTLPSAHAMWLSGLLQEGRLRSERGGTYPSWREVRRAFPGSTAEFTSFVKQPSWKRIRAAGLLLV